jgi:hypothetical protein
MTATLSARRKGSSGPIDPAQCTKSTAGAISLLVGKKEERVMSTMLDHLPTAKDLLKQIAQAEADKASKAEREHEAAEAEKKALIERLKKPTGPSEEEVVQRGAAIIRRAVESGLTEVQVYRFPNELCTDGGRAINQSEPGWEDTLTGAAKELHAFWHKHLRSRGYKIRYQIIDWPNGLPETSGSP